MNTTKKYNPSILLSIFFISILLVVFILARQYEKNERLLTFQKDINSYIFNIQNEIILNSEVLYSVGSFFALNKKQSREDFKKFVSPTLKRHTGIKALEWIPKLKHNQRDEYVKNARKTFLNFNIKEKINSKMTISSNKDLYYPVYYVEPYIGNEKALGYDLYSQLNRKEALLKSAKEKMILASSKINLVQEKQTKSAFLVFYPVFKKDVLLGFALGVFKIDDIIKTSLKNNSYENVVFSINDITTKKEMLYSNNFDDNMDASYSKSFEILGRTWQIVAIDTENSFLKLHILSLSVLFFGIIFILFLLNLFTKKKEAEKNLNDFNNKLKIEISKEITKNKLQAQQLLQKSKHAQMGEMISMIAHQWRQPLNSISVTSNNLNFKIMMNDINKDEFTKEINLISNYSQHLSNTIDDFRDFFKSNKSKEKISLNKIANDVLGIIGNSIEYQGIKIVLNLNSKKELNTFENELKQVLLNIIKNAEDILIEKKITTPIITISTRDTSNNECILCIKDNAGGVDKEIMTKIFDPYFSTKKAKDGTGLGLYMSKTIIQDHCGGKLNVSNDLDGAVFEIVLSNNKFKHKRLKNAK